MANPQLEDGRTEVANELSEAFARLYLSASESRVLWAILRKTYGWHKKFDRISFTQFEQLTGMNRRHIADALAKLIKRKIVTRRGNNYKLEYGLNKNFEEWNSLPIQATNKVKHLQSLPIEATKEIVTHRGNTPLPIEATKSLPIEANTKAKSNYTKASVPHTLKISNNGYIAELQKYLGFPERLQIDPIPNPAKEAKFIKKMLARGFTWPLIFDTWRGKVDSRGEFVSMQWVNEDIGKGGNGHGMHRRSNRPVPKSHEYRQPAEY